LALSPLVGDQAAAYVGCGGWLAGDPIDIGFSGTPAVAKSGIGWWL